MLDLDYAIYAYIFLGFITFVLLYWFGLGYVTSAVLALAFASYVLLQLMGDGKNVTGCSYTITLIFGFIYLSIFLFLFWLVWISLSIVWSLQTNHPLPYKKALFFDDTDWG